MYSLHLKVDELLYSHGDTFDLTESVTTGLKIICKTECAWLATLPLPKFKASSHKKTKSFLGGSLVLHIQHNSAD